MSIITPFGAALMQLYKYTVDEQTIGEGGYPFLMARKSGRETHYCWLEGCKDHDDALKTGMRELGAYKTDDAEYGVVGPCSSECACGRLRCITYFTE